jgi:gliding motility-associated lipoprotein GldD
MDKSRITRFAGIGIGLLFLCFACENNPTVPKPPCYLKTDFPEHAYYEANVKKPVQNYQVQLSKLFNVQRNLSDKAFGFQEIDLGLVNGTLLLYSRKFDHPDTLANLINDANDLVDEHKIKADRIDFEQIMDPSNRKFGTFFILKGNVATNFQFYLTDSTSQFIRGEVLLNCRPNYDSLRPTLDYLKSDLDTFIQSFRWKNRM